MMSMSALITNCVAGFELLSRIVAIPLIPRNIFVYSEKSKNEDAMKIQFQFPNLLGTPVGENDVGLIHWRTHRGSWGFNFKPGNP